MTRALGLQDTTGFHDWLNGIRDWVQLHGPDNWFFGGVLGFIGDVFNGIFTFLQKLFSIPAFPRPVPQIGWLGVVAICAWISWAVAGIRSSLLVTFSVLMFGIWGLWQDSIDLLLVTILAVLVCFLVGLPLGIAMARRRSVSAVVTPLLDVAQTLPPFAYLAPVALGFGIGPTTAIVLTVIYALPPLVRITEHGIKTVPESTIEAARSMGLTGTQLLRRVQLPMARRTIVVGVNQSMMAALSMATIAALVNGPGPGQGRQRRPADPEHRRRIGGRPADRVHGDHARPHHDCGERALREHGPRQRRLGQRSGRDAHRRDAGEDAALGDRGRRQGHPPAAAHAGRTVADPFRLADPGRDPGLPLPRLSSTWRSSPTATSGRSSSPSTVRRSPS